MLCVICSAKNRFLTIIRFDSGKRMKSFMVQHGFGYTEKENEGRNRYVIDSKTMQAKH